MCRDCIDLSVEITYTGAYYEYPDYFPTDIFDDAQQLCRREIYPRLSWMSSLKSLVLVKLGDFQTANDNQPFSSFPNLEALAKIEFFENCLLHYLPNLKYAHGSCFYNNEEVRTIINPLIIQ